MIATQTPNTQIEEWLSSHGASFELRTVKLTDIDTKKSLQNQARFQPLDEHIVLTYAEAMQEGSKFPPIVVLEGGKGGFLILDGNHRVAAADLSGVETFDAYVTRDLTDNQISVMTFDANTKHGLPTSPEERKQHAIYLVETIGISQKEAAKLLNVPYSELQYSLNVTRTTKRLASLGFDGTKIGSWARTRMGGIQSDAALLAVADLTAKARLSTEEVNRLVTEVNRTTSDQAAVEAVAAEKKLQESRIKVSVGGRTKVPDSLMRLTRSLGYAERIKPEDLSASSLDPALRESLQKRVTAAMQKLQEVADRLAK